MIFLADILYFHQKITHLLGLLQLLGGLQFHQVAVLQSCQLKLRQGMRFQRRLPIKLKLRVDKKNAYDSYEKLSSAVDGLFRGLLAAQIDHSAYSQEESGEKGITELLDGSCELVYEDNEGDRMLVGEHVCVYSQEIGRVEKL